MPRGKQLAQLSRGVRRGGKFRQPLPSHGKKGRCRNLSIDQFVSGPKIFAGQAVSVLVSARRSDVNLNPSLTVLTLVVSMSALSATLAAEDQRNVSSVLDASVDAPRLDLASVDLLSVIQQGQDEWQRQYDAARARKSGGKKKMFTGLALDGAGVAIVFLAANDCVNDIDIFSDCSGNASAALLGGLVAAGGGVVFIWGLIEYIDGNGEVRSLEARRPAGATPRGQAATVPLSDHQEIAFALGKRSTVGYRVSW